MSCVNSSSVFPKTITMKVGTWYTPANADGYSKDLPCESIEWSSEDPSIAGVNATNGYIYGNSVGTTTVHGRSAGCGEGGSIIVDVVETIPVCSVELEYSSLSIEYSDKVELNAIVTPSNATNKKINWSSTNRSVATVDSDGVVTAVSEGTAVITATSKYDSNKSASCTINVTKQKLVKKINVTTKNDIVAEGCSTQFEKEVIPSYALDTSVTWSSDSPHIATVNECNGIVYGIEEGEATIYATANDGSGVVGCCHVTVIPPILAECVDLGPTKITLAPDEEEPITASIVPPYASRRTVRWESKNPGIASVVERVPAVDTDVNYAAIIGHSKGTTTITATATDGSRAKSTCTVTVDPREKVIIEKEPNSEYSRIVFKNGKVWKCVNRDIINGDDSNSDESNIDDEIMYRFYDNVYTQKIFDSSTEKWIYSIPLKTYTDDEIKLIYTIDPYGLAAYIRIYADSLPSPEDSFQESVEVKLEYKDRIFSLLFNRSPKYYARDFDNSWYETNYRDDLTRVVSESEFLFGLHTVYDIHTFLAFLDVAIDLIAIALDSPWIIQIKDSLKVCETLVKFYSLSRTVGEYMVTDDFNSFVYDLITGLAEEDGGFIGDANNKTSNFKLGWAFELFSLAGDLAAIADTFNNGPHFYKEVFDYCETELNHIIMIRTTDDELVSISDINSVI